MPNRTLTMEEAYEAIERRIRFSHPDRAANNDPYYDEVAADVAAQVDMNELTTTRVIQEVLRKKVSSTVAGLAKSARNFLAQVADEGEEGLLSLLPTVTGREHLILKVPVTHEGRKGVDYVNVRLGVASRDDYEAWVRHNEAKLDEDVKQQRKQFAGARLIDGVLGRERVVSLEDLGEKLSDGVA